MRIVWIAYLWEKLKMLRSFCEVQVIENSKNAAFEKSIVSLVLHNYNINVQFPE